MKTKSEPEKSWMRVGRVVGREANQRARSDLYGTLCWDKRSEAICWSSGERCGSFEAVERNDRMSSVVDTTSPVGFRASPFIFLEGSRSTIHDSYIHNGSSTKLTLQPPSPLIVTQQSPSTIQRDSQPNHKAFNGGVWREICG